MHKLHLLQLSQTFSARSNPGTTCHPTDDDNDIQRLTSLLRSHREGSQHVSLSGWLGRGTSPVLTSPEGGRNIQLHGTCLLILKQIYINGSSSWKSQFHRSSNTLKYCLLIITPKWAMLRLSSLMGNRPVDIWSSLQDLLVTCSQEVAFFFFLIKVQFRI